MYVILEPEIAFSAADARLARLLGDTVEDYLAAIGNREIICVKTIPRLPKSPITLRGPGTYMTCREKKLKALQSYLTIAKYLLPIDRSIASSCLLHPDLHQENIFVNPENPSKIVAIIDWQLTELAPLYNQVRQPYFLDYCCTRDRLRRGLRDRNFQTTMINLIMLCKRKPCPYI